MGLCFMRPRKPLLRGWFSFLGRVTAWASHQLVTFASLRGFALPVSFPLSLVPALRALTVVMH